MYKSILTIIFPALMTLTMASIVNPALALQQINCQQTSIDSSGFSNLTAAKSWYPKQISIVIDGEDATLDSEVSGVVLKNKSNGRLKILFSTSNSQGGAMLNFDRFTTGSSQLKLQTNAGVMETGISKYNCVETEIHKTVKTDKPSKYARPDDVQEVILTSSDSDVWINTKTGEAMMKSGSKWFYRIIDDIKDGQNIQIGILSFDDKPNTDTISNDEFNTFSVDAVVTVDGGVEAIKANIKDVMKYLPSTRWYVLHMRSEDGSTAKFRLRVKN